MKPPPSEPLSYGQIHQHATLNAIKSSGSMLRVDEENFLKAVNKSNFALVVICKVGIINKRYQYLMPYKGLVFFCEVRKLLSLPDNIEMITARRMFLPTF